MPKNVKLLLTENVEALGIVGDVVNVRTGFARNYLLPRKMATTPSEEALKAVEAKRAEAQRQLAELRKQRESLISKLAGVHLNLVRPCNDLGHLYGSVTQQEISAALGEAGYPGVKPRDVRLHQTIKRVDSYDVHIKFEAELEATIKVTVAADRKLDTDKKEEIEIDDEGNLVEKPKGEAGKDGESRAERPRRDDKPAKKSRTDRLAESMALAEASTARKPGWGKGDAAPAEPAKDDKAAKPEKAPKGEKSADKPAKGEKKAKA